MNSSPHVGLWSPLSVPCRAEASVSARTVLFGRQRETGTFREPPCELTASAPAAQAANIAAGAAQGASLQPIRYPAPTNGLPAAFGTGAHGHHKSDHPASQPNATAAHSGGHAAVALSTARNHMANRQRSSIRARTGFGVLVRCTRPCEKTLRGVGSRGSRGQAPRLCGALRAERKLFGNTHLAGIQSRGHQGPPEHFCASEVL